MKKVCIQGLGFVGSAMSIAVALANDENGPKFDVVGVDLPTKNGNERVKSINSGIFPFKTTDNDLLSSLEKVKLQGNLRATTDKSVYLDADIIIVDIHLDISFKDDKPELEMAPMKSAIVEIADLIKPQALILIETTVPPGTCEKIISPCLEAQLKKRGMRQEDVYLAHSYERVMPGKDYLKSIIEYPRVFSGRDEKSADKCQEFLEEVLDTSIHSLTRLSSTTATETAKVMENTYRATNIAFIDEWTKYADSVNIDLFEIIEAIRKRPTHSNIMFPGLGVGGYCLTKDPTFTPAASRDFFGLDLDFPFSKLAVQTNNRMPFHTLDKLKKLMGNELNNKHILICGVTYREDVADTRYSASEILVRELKRTGANVSFHDPLLDYWEEMKMEGMTEIPKVEEYDAIVLAVGHTEYKGLQSSFWLGSKLILDANMVLTNTQIQEIRKLGIKIESIGRGRN